MHQESLDVSKVYKRIDWANEGFPLLNMLPSEKDILGVVSVLVLMPLMDLIQTPGRAMSLFITYAFGLAK